MPRIRKKTSNRQNTRDRAKIKRKVSEHNKKQKRDAKRNPTWKSKKKADPGIPNSFHLKDQVLADMAKEKRLAEEAKLARKEALKQKSKGAEAEEEDTPGIVSVQSRVLTATSALPVAGSSKQAQEEVPDLVDRALSTLQEVVDRADVILEVVDARDIQGGRSGYIEEMITEAKGRLLVVVNKADLVPRETLSSWLAHLPPTALLFSSTPLASSSSASPVLPGLAELKRALSTLSKSSKSDEPLVVALMGLPSVGKTSILNSLLSPSQTKHAVTPSILTAANAKHPDPTTKAPVEVKVTLEAGEVVHVIDTPGWEYAEDELEDEESETESDDEADAKKWDRLEEQVAGDLLRRNLGRIDRVKNVMTPLTYIVDRSNSEDLMTCYNLPYFQEGNEEAFLIALARANGRLKKGGEPDIDAAARIVLRDWSMNQFPYYSTPPKAEAAGGVPANADREEVKSVLELLRTRKEMRSSGRGLVRFRGGEIDSREIILDDDYLAGAGPSEDEEEDDDDEDVELDLEDDDEEDEEDDGEEEEDEDEEGALDSETERFLMDAANGDELDLEDGSEPESGSDLPEDSESEEEEEDEDDEPPVLGSKRKAVRSPARGAKEPLKRKRVSFGASVKFNEKPAPKAPKPGKLGPSGPGKRKRDEVEVKPAKQEKKAKSLPSKALAVNGKATAKPKKAAVFQASAKPNGGAGEDEAYDFSKHY